ncbi:MAG: hypothetical protein ACO3JL_16875 [Myxococcota bacterium]
MQAAVWVPGVLRLVCLWGFALSLWPGCITETDEEPAAADASTTEGATDDDYDGPLLSPTGGDDVAAGDDVTSSDDALNPENDPPERGRDEVGDLSLVQCRVDGDCGNGLSCQTLAPGGICTGCGDCPGDLECVFGSCVRSCESDDGCHPGFSCSGAGRCVLRACDDDTPCPAPFVCAETGRCARPACGPSNSCPAPFVCDGVLCVEPR